MELEWLLDRSQVDYHICRATVHYVSNNLRIKTEPVTFGADETVTVQTICLVLRHIYLAYRNQPHTTASAPDVTDSVFRRTFRLFLAQCVHSGYHTIRGKIEHILVLHSLLI